MTSMQSDYANEASQEESLFTSEKMSLHAYEMN